MGRIIINNSAESRRLEENNNNNTKNILLTLYLVSISVFFSPSLVFLVYRAQAMEIIFSHETKNNEKNG